MSNILNRVCPGLFIDSVVLMQISRSIASLEGVNESALMIGTPSNLDLLDSAGLLSDTSRKATGGDLIIAVRAKDDVTAAGAMAQAESLLEQPVVVQSETVDLQPRWRCPRGFISQVLVLKMQILTWGILQLWKR